MPKSALTGPRAEKTGRTYFKQYSLCFGVTALLVFFWFYIAGRSLVWEVDGYPQHYRAMIYYGQYLRAGLRSLFTGKGLNFPAWSFALGEGNDVLSSLHYYALGDPFCVLAVLIPPRGVAFFYSLMVVARLYCAGLAFGYLCFQTGQKNLTGILAGSLLYVFCYWGLRNAVRHPFFLNPLVWQPLIIAGAERVFRGKRATVLILAVFAAAVSSFYFLYMHAVLTAVYVLLRLLDQRRQWRSFLARVPILLASAALGAAMAAMVLAPILYTFFHDVRTGAAHASHLLYPLGYYTSLPHLLLSPESIYWLCIGLGAPVLVSLILLFYRDREHGFLRLLLLVGLLFILFPIFGQALNGFAYIANRWSWALAIVLAYGFTACWDRMMDLDKRSCRAAAIWVGLYMVLCMLCYIQYRMKTVGLALGALLFLYVIWPKKRRSRLYRRLGKPTVALLLVIFSVFVTSFARYAPFITKTSLEGKLYSELSDSLDYDETAELLRAAEADGFEGLYRVSGRELTENAGLLAGLSSTQYYWSLSNPGVSQFRIDVGVNEALTSKYKGYDDRAALLALTGVRYYARPLEDDQAVPCGYVSTGIRGKTHEIYRSEYALTAGAVYDSWIDRETFESLCFTDKQAILLRTLVVAAPIDGLPRYEGGTDVTEAAWELAWAEPDVTAGDGVFTVTAPEAGVCLRLRDALPGETLCELTGLTFTPTSGYELYFGSEEADPQGLYGEAEWEALSEKTQRRLQREDTYAMDPTKAEIRFSASTGAENNLEYYTPDEYFYAGRHDFAVNLRDAETPVTEVVLRFSEPGVYRFDSLRFYVQPLSDYADRIADRREAELENLELGTDSLRGEITLDRRMALCLPVPVSAGWTAEVDGQPARLLQANVKYMALVLEPGTHQISLRYTRPRGALGWAASLAAWLLFALWLLAGRHLRKRRTCAIIPSETD